MPETDVLIVAIQVVVDGRAAFRQRLDPACELKRRSQLHPGQAAPDRAAKHAEGIMSGAPTLGSFTLGVEPLE